MRSLLPGQNTGNKQLHQTNIFKNNIWILFPEIEKIVIFQINRNGYLFYICGHLKPVVLLGFEILVKAVRENILLKFWN